ncbi:MAG: type II toxin-antitoxin system RelE/ParE family toxin [Cellvibrionaceae bacterium]|nr:type II toxin-antitoxin system RelE/ParE family toxin [Cellvibrionaceae bacterium]
MATLPLSISRQVARFIKTLPFKQYKQVVSTILALANDPQPHDSKLLKGSKQHNRRVDVGEYRVVYRVENETLLILVAGKRNDDEVYKILDRL